MVVFLSRLVSVAAATAVLSLGLAACSGAPEDSTLPRSQTPAARLPSSTKGTKSTGDAPPATTPPASTPDPDGGAAGTPTPTPAPAPTPAPVPGSCGAPKCFGLAGLGGCKATDSAGALVTMACQDGACACLSVGQETTTFDGDVNSSEDARSLFLTSCTCN